MAATRSRGEVSLPGELPSGFLVKSRTVKSGAEFNTASSLRASSVLTVTPGFLQPLTPENVAVGANGSVTITGFLNQTEIPKAYTAGDVLVLPSASEPWGLVVNEGMNFGLPVVASDRVGCVADLVRPGVNGSVFRFDSTAELANALTELVADDSLRQRYGKASLERIHGWGIEHTVAGIQSALESVGSQSSARPKKSEANV